MRCQNGQPPSPSPLAAQASKGAMSWLFLGNCIHETANISNIKAPKSHPYFLLPSRQQPLFYLFHIVDAAISSTMRFLSLPISCLLAAGVNALVDLPQVSQLVTSALQSMSIPIASLTEPHATASTTLATVYHNATATAGSPRINAAVADAAYWLKDIPHQGLAAFNSNPAGYKVFRNVKDYGAKGIPLTLLFNGSSATALIMNQS